MTAFYGDDKTHVQGNPKAFFGFSSFSKLINYVENISRDERSRTSAYEISPHIRKFTETDDMFVALDLAKNGWNDGAKKAQEISELLSLDKPLIKKYVNSTSGGFVNVSKMLSGNPVHMRKKSKIEGRKNISLFVNVGNSAFVKAEYMILKSCVLAAIIDMLERTGYSCEVVGFFAVKNDFDEIVHQTTVVLKNYGEKMSVNDLVFSLGHPSFLRRLIFAIVGTSQECQQIWNDQGIPCHMFDECIPVLNQKNQQQLNSSDNVVKTIFDIIISSHSKLRESQFSMSHDNDT